MLGRNSVLLGPTRSGKSTKGAREMLAFDGVGVYIDPKGTDEELRAALAPRDDAIVCYDAKTALDYTRTHDTKFVLLRARWGVSIQQEADALLRAVMAWKNPPPPGFENVPVMVVVDEAHRLGLRKWSTETVAQDLFATCRGYGVSATLIAQHASTVPNDLVQNCDWVQVWGAHPTDAMPAPHPVTVKWWEGWFGQWLDEMNEWIAGAPHRSVGTDMGAVYLIDENDRRVKSIGRVEPAEEPPAEDVVDLEDADDGAEEPPAVEAPAAGGEPSAQAPNHEG